MYWLMVKNCVCAEKGTKAKKIFCVLGQPDPLTKYPDPRVLRIFLKRRFQNGGKGIFLDQMAGKNVMLDNFCHLKKCKKKVIPYPT